MPKIMTNEQVIEMVKKSGDIKQFEPVVKQVTAASMRRLIETTAKQTGDTRRSWGNLMKIGVSAYKIVNNKLSRGGKKWSIPRLLNDGSDEYTKASGSMFIPLSNKGRSKPLGQKIPKDFVWGKDFVLSKKRKGIKGTKFIDKEVIKAREELQSAVLKKIGELNT